MKVRVSATVEFSGGVKQLEWIGGAAKYIVGNYISDCIMEALGYPDDMRVTVSVEKVETEKSHVEIGTDKGEVGEAHTDVVV